MFVIKKSAKEPNLFFSGFKFAPYKTAAMAEWSEEQFCIYHDAEFLEILDRFPDAILCRVVIHDIVTD